MSLGVCQKKRDVFEYMENNSDRPVGERLELLKRYQLVCSQKTKQMKNYGKDELQKQQRQ